MIGKEGCLIPNFWIEEKVDSMAAWKAGASGENIPSMVEKKMLLQKLEQSNRYIKEKKCKTNEKNCYPIPFLTLDSILN